MSYLAVPKEKAVSKQVVAKLMKLYLHLINGCMDSSLQEKIESEIGPLFGFGGWAHTLDRYGQATDFYSSLIKVISGDLSKLFNSSLARANEALDWCLGAADVFGEIACKYDGVKGQLGLLATLFYGLVQKDSSVSMSPSAIEAIEGFRRKHAWDSVALLGQVGLDDLFERQGTQIRHRTKGEVLSLNYIPDRDLHFVFYENGDISRVEEVDFQGCWPEFTSDGLRRRKMVAVVKAYFYKSEGLFDRRGNLGSSSTLYVEVFR